MTARTCHYHRVMATRKSNRVRVGPQGRIVIPAHIREAAGIKPGDTLILLEEDGQISLHTDESIWRKIREGVPPVAPGVSVVDELIAERREEARRESMELEAARADRRVG
ncbi:MAG: AbrB/MazE/SpoVT family DNA-binding domain-containing protein [Dehalococcoidia bacterium]|nr:AbrB/MazE/SpoVT family DNA-binding domain-containing protein [Dehalococcoidia bacterium]